MKEPIWLISPPITFTPDRSRVWNRIPDIYIQGPSLLKIEASGSWTYSKKWGRPCSADGDMGSVLDVSKCIYPKANVGALIGRIGGSTSDLDPTGIFVVGSYSVHKILVDIEGPLFLTMNSPLRYFEDIEGELKVVLSVNGVGAA